MSLILAIPSKGRLKEQTEAWLADGGFRLEIEGGARGYRASLRELPGAEVRLLSASEIAAALESGEVHLGVTGEDVILERGPGALAAHLLMGLGFGRADLVVAAPKSWIDVETMDDLEEVARLFLARTGRRLRVATKYGVLTRSFFTRFGVENYRIVDSAGATEGAPAAGAAELVVDITTTGATLEANGLKVIGDGVILKSQAQLAASLRAPWTAERLRLAGRLVHVAEARARAKDLATLGWPRRFDAAAAGALAGLGGPDAPTLPRPAGDGVLVPLRGLFAAVEALSAAGVGPVSVTRPHYVFEAASAALAALGARLDLPAGSETQRLH